MSEGSGEKWTLPERVALWFGVLLVGGFVALMLWIPRRVPERVEAEVLSSEELLGGEEDSGVGSDEEAREVLEAYFEGAGVDERMAWVRGGEAVKAMMEEYYGRPGKVMEMMSRVSKPRRLVAKGRTWVAFEVLLWDGGKMVVPLVWEGGVYRVDWENMVAYGEMDWVEWCERRPRGVFLMRLRVGQMPGERDSDLLGDEYVLEDRERKRLMPAAAAAECVGKLERLTRDRMVPLRVKVEWRERVATVVEVEGADWSR